MPLGSWADALTSEALRFGKHTAVRGVLQRRPPPGPRSGVQIGSKRDGSSQVGGFVGATHLQKGRSHKGCSQKRRGSPKKARPENQRPEKECHKPGPKRVQKFPRRGPRSVLDRGLGACSESGGTVTSCLSGPQHWRATSVGTAVKAVRLRDKQRHEWTRPKSPRRASATTQVKNQDPR